MEYTADFRGELNFSSWVSDQIEEQLDTPVSAPMSDQAQGEGGSLMSDPETLPGHPALDLALQELSLAPMSDQVPEGYNKALLDEMLDRIQKLAISDDQPSIYERIWESPGKVGNFGPPSTHLVTNIEDLTAAPKR